MRVLVCVALLVFSFSTNAQESKQMERDQFVVVPRDIVMPLLAVQPDCPFQFEQVERLAKIGGGGANIYKLRNRSTKPIRNFRIAYLLGNGNGGSWGWENNFSRLVNPGDIVPDTLENSVEKLVPLNDALRNKLDLRGPMKTVIIYFVEWVEFADGSTYRDEATYKALQLYLEQLGETAYRSEQKSRGRRSQ